jgi:RNA polymerase sigma factor (sigma-70 family)
VFTIRACAFLICFMQPSIHQTIDHLFRHQSGKLVAVLSRFLGLEHMETAHDIVQDTLLQALSTWTYNGLPDNPSAWLNKVAKNKAIDYLRRGKNFKVNISPQYSYLLRSEYILTPTVNHFFEEDEIQDSQLRMIFACCHPAIPQESQTALALKTLCGLSSAEIAKAFLTTEETIAKRIYRAKEKIRHEKIELELPSAETLPARLEGVLKTLYLLFNEGYNSSHPDQLIREDLCEEAMRLAYVLTLHQITNCSKVQALLALFCFQASRLQARLDDKGNIILLKYQNRSKWYWPLVQKGFYYMDLAVTEPFDTSAYHLEAAIASLHASAKSFEKTDWKSIAFLYEQLYRIQPTSIVALNQAIVSGYVYDKEYALERLKEIKGLESYYLYYTSIGEMYYELGNKAEARKYYEAALKLTTSRQEHQLLENKIQNCLQAL